MSLLTSNPRSRIDVTTITLTIEAKDAAKIAEALNHVYREIFDKSREGEPLRDLARQITEKANQAGWAK
jgi:hypothetical protein